METGKMHSNLYLKMFLTMRYLMHASITYQLAQKSLQQKSMINKISPALNLPRTMSYFTTISLSWRALISLRFIVTCFQARTDAIVIPGLFTSWIYNSKNLAQRESLVMMVPAYVRRISSSSPTCHLIMTIFT